jgi:hypothetical protein
VKELVTLLGEADTFEIKRRIDYTLNTVIEQSGEQVSPLHLSTNTELNHKQRSRILSTSLWDPFRACVRLSSFSQDVLNLFAGTGAGEDWLFKASLLVTVTKLVEVIISHYSMDAFTPM